MPAGRRAWSWKIDSYSKNTAAVSQRRPTMQFPLGSGLLQTQSRCAATADDTTTDGSHEVDELCCLWVVHLYLC